MKTQSGPARARFTIGGVDDPPTALFAAPGAPPPPLVLSSYTLGTAVEYADRVAAAAAAGFAGIGLRAENYWAAVDSGMTATGLADLAATQGVPVREVEYVTGWGTPADRDDEQRRKERTVFEMARVFGVHHVNVGLLEKLPRDAVLEAFAALCDRAGDDLTVALEFMPYSGVPDLKAAWDVVSSSGRGNGALLIDLWHWVRAGVRVADLDFVPAEAVVSLQLCDVRARPMPAARSESLGHRRPPGEGRGDTVGVLRALRDRGIRPAVVAVEVIWNELVATGVGNAATRCHDAALAVLTEAAG